QQAPGPQERAARNTPEGHECARAVPTPRLWPRTPRRANASRASISIADADAEGGAFHGQVQAGDRCLERISVPRQAGLVDAQVAEPSDAVDRLDRLRTRQRAGHDGPGVALDRDGHRAV